MAFFLPAFSLLQRTGLGIGSDDFLLVPILQGARIGDLDQALFFDDIVSQLPDDVPVHFGRTFLAILPEMVPLAI